MNVGVTPIWRKPWLSMKETHPLPRKVQAVMDAMMTMVKLDVAALEKAYDGPKVA